MQYPGSRGPVIFSAILVEGGLAVAAWGLGAWWGYPPQSQMRFEWLALAEGLLALVPMLLLMLWVAHSRWRPWRRLSVLVRHRVVPLFAECSYLDLALISALAGLGEEAMFRGVLQPALTAWWGPWPALAAVSVLFGLAHMMTPGYFILATIMGGYLGWLAIATNNLLPSVVAHAAYDFLALIYLARWSPAKRKLGRK
jgi:uncharacterized protein